MPRTLVYEKGKIKRHGKRQGWRNVAFMEAAKKSKNYSDSLTPFGLIYRHLNLYSRETVRGVTSQLGLSKIDGSQTGLFRRGRGSEMSRQSCDVVRRRVASHRQSFLGERGDVQDMREPWQRRKKQVDINMSRAAFAALRCVGGDMHG